MVRIGDLKVGQLFKLTLGLSGKECMCIMLREGRYVNLDLNAVVINTTPGEMVEVVEGHLMVAPLHEPEIILAVRAVVENYDPEPVGLTSTEQRLQNALEAYDARKKPYTPPKLRKLDERCVVGSGLNPGSTEPVLELTHVEGCKCDGC